MNVPLKTAAGKEERMEWIEPEIHELEVRETSLNPTTGGDGGFTDCSLS